MYLKREITSTMLRLAKFPVIAVIGPRQSGKTTLVKNVFKNHVYLTLENPSIRDMALTDPERLLRQHENDHGIILDEFQYAPQILSYIQIAVDERKRPGYFILTGSQNFLVNEKVTQSLAGRVGIITLLPMSLKEILENNILKDMDHAMFNGCYPRLYAENFSPLELYPPYIHTYVERDVRQLINVENLHTFQNFIKLCAGHVGQSLDVARLATNCGINRKTAAQWLSLLEASYILFFLRPHFNNFNKIITKTPKLYFFDTGLACSLLGIRSAGDLALSHFRGHLFESYIIADLYKQYCNAGLQVPLYFWRDHNGRIEIDCLIDMGIKQIPVEIKSSETIAGDFFNGIKKWSELAQESPENGYVVYGGEQEQHRSSGTVIGWKAAGDLIAKIEKLQ